MPCLREPAVNPYRLPTTVRPRRYDLTISPDLDRRDFVGQVQIEVTVAEPTATVVMNAAELEILRAWVVDGDGVRIDTASVELDAATERVTLTLQRTLRPGDARVHVEFVGTLNDRLAGFYSSTYTPRTARRRPSRRRSSSPPTRARPSPAGTSPTPRRSSGSRSSSSRA